MSKVKAKFRCGSVSTLEAYGEHKSAVKVVLYAVPSANNSKDENSKSLAATLSGMLEMHIENPEGQIFQSDKDYYLTIEEAD